MTNRALNLKRSSHQLIRRGRKRLPSPAARQRRRGGRPARRTTWSTSRLSGLVCNLIVMELFCFSQSRSEIRARQDYQVSSVLISIELHLFCLRQSRSQIGYGGRETCFGYRDCRLQEADRCYGQTAEVRIVTLDYLLWYFK